MTFPAYPAYRDSGNPWIGSLPVGWEVVALKRDLHFLTSGSRGWADHYADEGALFLRIGNLPRDGLELDLADIQRVAVPAGAEGERTRVEPGDVLFSITAFMGSVAVVPDNLECAYVSQHVALARLRGDLLLPRWVGYATLSAAGKAYLDAQCYGGTKIQLSLDDVANLPVTVPSVAEQLALIAFLDRETGKIDALVAEQERLIALLKEKRQAVISQAVTKGLDAGAPMKDSGVAWLGQVPAHWRLVRAKFLFRQCDESPPDDCEIVTCFRDGQVTLRRNRRQDGFTIAVLEGGYQAVRIGQLVIHSMDAFAGAIGVSDSDGRCTPEYIVCEPATPDLHTPYYGYLLRLMALRGFVLAICPAVRERAPRIRFPDFGEMLLPVSQLDEQKRILTVITDECRRLDELIGEAHRAIALLRERRAALTSAAVTGKIDVRGLAAAAAESAVAA